MTLTVLDLFSGIGGFSYAAEQLVGGFKTKAFCEVDAACQAVLRKRWPDVPIFDDVCSLTANDLDFCQRRSQWSYYNYRALSTKNFVWAFFIL